MSDWVYESTIAHGLLKVLIMRLGWLASATLDRFVTERNHDLRAAFLCLLTAGFAYADIGHAWAMKPADGLASAA